MYKESGTKYLTWKQCLFLVGCSDKKLRKYQEEGLLPRGRKQFTYWELFNVNPDLPRTFEDMLGLLLWWSV